MTRITHQNDHDTPARLEVRALEKMLRALCRYVAMLVSEVQPSGESSSRETTLQAQAFDERRKQALAQLKDDCQQPDSIRIGNLEKLVEALDCSRDYFSRQRLDSQHSSKSPAWIVRVK